MTFVLVFGEVKDFPIYNTFRSTTNNIASNFHDVVDYSTSNMLEIRTCCWCKFYLASAYFDDHLLSNFVSGWKGNIWSRQRVAANIPLFLLYLNLPLWMVASGWYSTSLLYSNLILHWFRKGHYGNKKWKQESVDLPLPLVIFSLVHCFPFNWKVIFYFSLKCMIGDCRRVIMKSRIWASRESASLSLIVLHYLAGAVHCSDLWLN